MNVDRSCQRAPVIMLLQARPFKRGLPGRRFLSPAIGPKTLLYAIALNGTV